MSWPYRLIGVTISRMQNKEVVNEDKIAALKVKRDGILPRCVVDGVQSFFLR
jgi:hypothetical protein